MRRKTTVSILVAVLALIVVFSSADAQLLKRIIKAKGGGGSDIVELISLIPDDAQLLLSLNWENLAKTDLIEMGKEQLGEDLEIIKQIGIDIDKDIKHVILGITFEDEPEFYGVIAGSFDEEKIMKLVSES